MVVVVVDGVMRRGDMVIGVVDEVRSSFFSAVSLDDDDESGDGDEELASLNDDLLRFGFRLSVFSVLVFIRSKRFLR